MRKRVVALLFALILAGCAAPVTTSPSSTPPTAAPPAERSVSDDPEVSSTLRTRNDTYRGVIEITAGAGVADRPAYSERASFVTTNSTGAIGGWLTATWAAAAPELAKLNVSLVDGNPFEGGRAVASGAGTSPLTILLDETTAARVAKRSITFDARPHEASAFVQQEVKLELILTVPVDE